MISDPRGTQAPLGERIANRAIGYWRFLRHEARIWVNVGFFMLISGFLIVVLIFSIFRVQPRYEISAIFADSGGVFTGQEVTYRGVTVGRVGDLHVIHGGVKINMIVDSKYNRIPKDGTKARVMFKSAVGEQFIDLLPSTRVVAPFLKRGDVIAMKDTVLPVQQEELLRLLDKVLTGIPPESIGRLVTTLGEGLGGKGPELHDALAALDPLTAVLANRTSELNDLAVSGDTLGTAFDATASDFVSGVKGFGRVSSALGRGQAGLARLLESGAKNLPDLNELVAARKADLDTTIKYLAEATNISYENLESVEDTLDYLPLLLGALVDAYDPPTNRFRFGQLLSEVRNLPCSYHTPRRTVGEKSGNASYQPILDFNC